MLILTGKSTTGKDTIAKELIRLGYSKLITYTTRPIRYGELNGETYYYISTSEFLKKYIDGDFLEVNYYTTDEGMWFYGSAIEDYKKADKNTLCILTPSGIEKLEDNEIDYISFLIDISDKEILKRQLKRGDKIEEAKRRFRADKIDFKNSEYIVDYVINNENRDVREVAKEIDELYKSIRR
jgi:guanylate kinase